MAPPQLTRCAATILFLSFLSLFPLTLAQTGPSKVACPRNFIRPAGPVAAPALSAEERAYVSGRTANVLPDAWKTYLASVRAALPPGTDLPSYVSEILDPKPPKRPYIPSRPADLPKLGIALSGGGLRATYFAAGVLTSIDGRNTTHPTGSNGLLQAATYLAGLSGGAWFTTALAQANFPTVPELVFPSNAPASNDHFGGFLSELDITAPGADELQNAGYFQAVLSELVPKVVAGFPVTLADGWTRMIARHFVNGTTADTILNPGPHGDGITFSGLKDLPSIKAHAQPFPIVVWNAIPPALVENPNDPKQLADIVPGNSVPVGSEIWEVNMFETGSWDPSLASFIPTRLLGSTPAFGTGPNKVDAQCFEGVDQAAYVAGISSSVFNYLNGTTNLLPYTQEGALINVINATFPSPVSVRLDSAALPNPFKGVNPRTYPSSSESYLSLVDGGSNGEVLPLQPLIMRSRGVDVIYAVDAPADLPNSYTNGSDIVNTAARAKRFSSGKLYPFPRVPASPQTFIDKGLTLRPTIFGCLPEDERNGAPIVVYVANGGASAEKRAKGEAGLTGTPTVQTTYSKEMAQAFMDESFAIATQGLGLNSTSVAPGQQWSTCLACAVVDRARARRGERRQGVCAECFNNYCWDGRE
ncbi:Lysophospholipase 3 [Psilocybe cubensis]|uniref:Lysophospholipase 3 n=2 Tax=Psilocybe cubensis TaxID=181762 RepID=A0ACB8GLD5_PSICU|nr:Lysophospholipase 3 [Psilocybe cubensis]KAH9476207.1 Lysophospholipase 3 [Psilocybe cubensis]